MNTIKGYARKVIKKLFYRPADDTAYNVALEKLLEVKGTTNPHELFSQTPNDFWFWLNTQGYRKHQSLKSLLPGTPSVDIQLNYTGSAGDGTLRDGFKSYMFFKELYETHIGPISNCSSVLDYGCGWGRIIRFFIRDIDPAKIWGADPVEEMINICKEQNKWCNFEKIPTTPPTEFKDSSFGLIYSFSVFSHLSEERHTKCLDEFHRILEPGGLLLITTRSRDFIDYCGQLRKEKELDTLHEGPRSSASAFLDTKQSLEDYDNGIFCHTQLGTGDASYWGETAIPKSYVLTNWTRKFKFLDFISDTSKCEQNVIVVQKPF